MKFALARLFTAPLRSIMGRLCRDAYDSITFGVCVLVCSYVFIWVNWCGSGCGIILVWIVTCERYWIDSTMNSFIALFGNSQQSNTYMYSMCVREVWVMLFGRIISLKIGHVYLTIVIIIEAAIAVRCVIVNNRFRLCIMYSNEQTKNTQYSNSSFNTSHELGRFFYHEINRNKRASKFDFLLPSTGSVQNKIRFRD